MSDMFSGTPQYDKHAFVGFIDPVGYNKYPVKPLEGIGLKNKICEIFMDNSEITVDDIIDPLFDQLFKNVTDLTRSRSVLDLTLLYEQFQTDINEMTRRLKLPPRPLLDSVDDGSVMVPYNILGECFPQELRSLYDDALANALKVLIDMDHKNDQKYVVPSDEHNLYYKGITPKQNILFPRMIALAKVMNYYVRLHHHIRYPDLKLGGKKSRLRSKKRGRKSVHRRKKSMHKKRK